MSENKLPDGCPGKAVWNPYNKGHELLQSEEYAASSPQDDDVVVEIHPVGTLASLNGGGWEPDPLNLSRAIREEDVQFRGATVKLAGRFSAEELKAISCEMMRRSEAPRGEGSDA